MSIKVEGPDRCVALTRALLRNFRLIDQLWCLSPCGANASIGPITKQMVHRQKSFEMTRRCSENFHFKVHMSRHTAIGETVASETKHTDLKNAQASCRSSYRRQLISSFSSKQKALEHGISRRKKFPNCSTTFDHAFPVPTSNFLRVSCVLIAISIEQQQFHVNRGACKSTIIRSPD